MNIENARKKLKLYKGIYTASIITLFILFICAITPEFNMVVIFSIILVTSIIPLAIINKKRKYYKQLVYDLMIKESAIKDTLNEQHLK